MLIKWLWIGLAGAAGTLARYGLSGLVSNWNGTSFPWGNVAVNLTGCLFFGIIWSILEEHLTGGGELRVILLVGFMGGYTTFSSFIFETAQLLRDSEWWLALANLGIQNLGGLALLVLGMALGRLI